MNMKVSHIFWGTLFIIIGLLFLLSNFTTINLDWGNIWEYWPLVLILIGASLLTKHKFGKGLFAFLAALFLAIVIFASFNSAMSFVNNDFEIVFNDEDTSNIVVKEFSAPFDSLVVKNIFHLSGGAGVFKITSATDSAIFIRTRGLRNTYRFSDTRFDDSIGKFNLDLKQKGIVFGIGKRNKSNLIDVSLNKHPVWDLDFDLGAAALKLDLTQFKIEKLTTDMGAAKLELKLGSLSDVTDIKIDAGASKIEIAVPEEAGCQLKMDDVLSSNNLEGFTRVKKKLYRTTNFDETDKKIYIDIDSGVSSIHIWRYKTEEE